MYNGRITRGSELGYVGSNTYVWHACKQCGKERWVVLKTARNQKAVCRECYLKKLRKNHSHNWNGGNYKRQGYLVMKLYPDEPLFRMAGKDGYAGVHRLIMAEKLGRCLLKSEHVHHKNGIKDDNRIENLELISPTNHQLYKQMCAYCELRKEIRLQKWRIKNLEEQVRNLTSCLMGIGG